MIVTHRERDAETQAEREAGSMHREPDMGLHPKIARTHIAIQQYGRIQNQCTEISGISIH